MATTQTARNPQVHETGRRDPNLPEMQAADLKEDLVEYLSCYARQNPSHAALFCIGVGFVLGWKLKPW